MNKYLLTTLLFVCFAYLLLLQVNASWLFTIDDMYISLRYAKHWAAGHGLLWNIGEAPVEGYSNYSFVVLAAMALHWELDPVLVLKSAGVLGLVFTTIALYLLSRLWFMTWLAWVPCLWMLLYRGQIIWAVSGLETTVYQALIAFALFFLLRGMGYVSYPGHREQPKRHYFLLSGFLFALSAMTRPEAPALALLFWGIAFFDCNKTYQQQYYKSLLQSILLFAAVFAPYFFWRWHYYGRLFPNTVYCKGFTDFSQFSLDLSYLKLAWPFMLLVLPAIVWIKDRRHYFFWLPSIVYLGLLIGADPLVAFFNRLFLPVWILLLPLALLGIANCLEYFLQKKDKVYYGSLVFAACFVAFSFIPTMSLADYRYFTLNPQAGEQLRQEVVVWLANHLQPNQQVVLLLQRY